MNLSTSAVDDSHGIIWWARLLLLVLFGQQFQPPLSSHSQHIIAFFAVLLSRSVYAKAQARDNVTTSAHSIPVRKISQDVSSWAQSILCASLVIFVLHQQSPGTRFYCLTSGWILYIVLIIVDTPKILAALPVWQFDLHAALFLVLTAYSVAYHAQRGLKDVETYVEYMLQVLRTVRAMYDKMAGQALRPSDLDASERRMHSSRPPAAPSPEAQNRARVYAQWNNGLAYEDLRGDEIRLLEIISVSPSDIKCTMQHVSLANVDSRYTALSYNWGADIRKRSMTINDQTVVVPANMHDALKEIQQHGFTTLWIDVICINQRNLPERNSQLLQMGTIFRKAQQVVAWLGTEDEAARKVMSLLRTTTSNAFNPNPQSNADYSRSLEDIRSFVERPYWRRAWIVQEIANAVRVIFVCCGKQADLNQVQHLVTSMLDLQSNVHMPQFLGNLQLIKDVLDIRNRRYSDQSLGLLELLMKTCNSEASVPHDKAFSLLSLATDQDHFMRYAPSYDISTDEMSYLMTKSFFKDRRSLDIILVGPRKIETSRLPSWCPDYFHADKEPMNEDMIDYMAGNDLKHRLGRQGRFWQTTLTSKAEENKSMWIDGNILRVHAVHVGTIDGVNVTTSTNEENFTLVRTNTGTSSRRVRQASIRSYSTYDGLARVFLMYDRKYEQFTKAPLFLGLLYMTAYKIHASLSSVDSDADKVYKWLQANRDFSIHGTSLHDRALWSSKRIVGNWFKVFAKKNAHMTNILDYSHLSKVIAEILREGLHLITLRQGQIGWADPHARLDDEIFLLSGCTVPVVLRRVPGSGMQTAKYRVIGKAYVDEFMDGEKWKQATEAQTPMDNGLKVVTVDIC